MVYINDIVNDIGSSIKLFADDTSLYVIVEDAIMAANLMDSDLDKMHNWANEWLVNFNPHKTEEMMQLKYLILSSNGQYFILTAVTITST